MSYENQCDGSFIKMPSKKVSEMAKARLAWIEQYKKDRRQKHIDKNRQEMINGWWHRFRKLPIPTDQEVIDYIEDSYRNGNWGINWWPVNHYSESEAVANRLINACEHAEDIYISTEDLQRIS
jgi:hypothetical protein